MFCRNCGANISDDSVFCPQCGSSTTASMENPQPQYQQPQYQQPQYPQPQITYYQYQPPIPQPVDVPPYKKWWFWPLMVFAVGMVIAVAITGSNSDTNDSNSVNSYPTSSNVQQAEKEIIEISAEDLFAAYQENEVAADKKYKGKTLRVTGTVDSIGSDILDQVYITLETGELVFSVQCYFKDNKAIDKVAELKAGDTVTIVGKCDGILGNVSMKNCKFE